MNMPNLFFENFYKWKTEMEREKGMRQKDELKKQKDLQTKIKGQQYLNTARQRIKSSSNRK